MTETQKKIACLYLVCIFLSCIYVPWKAGSPDARHQLPARYGFVFTPPLQQEYVLDLSSPNTPNQSAVDKFRSQHTRKNFIITGIDTTRFVITLIGITALFGAAYILTLRKREAK